jgi:excisionase family DNA binding protein
VNAADALAAALDALKAELREELLVELRTELHADLEALRDGGGPAYMTVPEAAAFAGISEGRIRKLLTREVLSRVQEAPGHRVLIARADLEALMETWRRGVMPNASA